MRLEKNCRDWKAEFITEFNHKLDVRFLGSDIAATAVSECQYDPMNSRMKA